MQTPHTGQPAETTFRVTDMSCNHCVGAIRKALESRLPGAPVAIDLAGKTVKVGGDAAAAEEAIREAGYEPVRQ